MTINEYSVAGNLISDQNVVANAFNNFFTNTAQNLVNKLSLANNHYKDYLNDLSLNHYKDYLNDLSISIWRNVYRRGRVLGGGGGGVCR